MYYTRHQMMSSNINFIKKELMNTQELRELVKSHFSLVDAPAETEVIATETTEQFGELKDVNGAFTIKFPGDSLQIGDKVSVITAEGQEMDAPNGTHELEDGTKIITEDSVVKEIMGADGEKAMAEEEAVEEIIEEVAEEMSAEEQVEEFEADETEEVVSATIEDVVKEIVSAVEEEMGKMKEKMAELEAKFESFNDAPASEPTKEKKFTKQLPNKKATLETFSVDTAANADRIKLAISQIKNKK